MSLGALEVVVVRNEPALVSFVGRSAVSWKKLVKYLFALTLVKRNKIELFNDIEYAKIVVNLYVNASID